MRGCQAKDLICKDGAINMFYINKAYKRQIFKISVVVASALAILSAMKLNALAQAGRFPGDRPYYEERDGGFYRDDRDRRRFEDRDYPNRRLFRDDGYYVKVVRDNPEAFGAKLRYLKDDWDKKYMLWAPDKFNKQGMRPLVISLHGNDEGVADAFARFYNTITQYNYAFVAPGWKAGDKVMTPEELSVFIDGIISELKEKEGLNVDPARVILHGYERGANMAGYLYYINRGKYIMAVVDSGPFPAVSGGAGGGASPSSGSALSIPADELKKLAGGYIYLYSRYEDQAMYQKLEQSRQSLAAAGARAELYYTKGLLSGAFSKTLSKSVVDMFDRAIAGK